MYEKIRMITYLMFEKFDQKISFYPIVVATRDADEPNRSFAFWLKR